MFFEPFLDGKIWIKKFVLNFSKTKFCLFENLFTNHSIVINCWLLIKNDKLMFRGEMVLKNYYFLRFAFGTSEFCYTYSSRGHFLSVRIIFRWSLASWVYATRTIFLVLIYILSTSFIWGYTSFPFFKQYIPIQEEIKWNLPSVFCVLKIIKFLSIF